MAKHDDDRILTKPSLCNNTTYGQEAAADNMGDITVTIPFLGGLLVRNVVIPVVVVVVVVVVVE
jgi:hypothetical protein